MNITQVIHNITGFTNDDGAIIVSGNGGDLWLEMDKETAKQLQAALNAELREDTIPS